MTAETPAPEGRMTKLAVVTPSYEQDFELCRALHGSVLSHMPDGVVHHIVVPDRDVETFAELASDRCRIWPLGELVPARFLALPRINAWMNLRHPWPPVRGWVMQQMAKLEVTARLDADAVVVMDSDELLVRSVTADLVVRDGRCVLYRSPDAVHAGLRRHETWHHVARRLLGLPRAGLPFHDYVNSLQVWDPLLVAALRERVEVVTGRRWLDAFGACIDFSEDTLYGVFVDEVVGGADPGAVRCPCHNYWDTVPLDADSAVAFARELGADDVAIMISSKSHTPLEVRQVVADELASAGFDPGATPRRGA
jgi:hypothetical protein